VHYALPLRRTRSDVKLDTDQEDAAREVKEAAEKFVSLDAYFGMLSRCR
jgi:hypothetical protein